VHAVVVRSTFATEKAKNTSHSGALFEVAMSKKCMPLSREAHFEVKSAKTDRFGPLLEVEMSKKCTPLWREAHFEVKTLKTPHVWTTFLTFRCRFAWQAQGIVHLAKSEKTWNL